MPNLPPEIIDEIEELCRNCEKLSREAEGIPGEVGVDRVSEVGNILVILKMMKAVGHLRAVGENERAIARLRNRIEGLISDPGATGKSGLTLR